MVWKWKELCLQYVEFGFVLHNHTILSVANSDHFGPGYATQTSSYCCWVITPAGGLKSWPIPNAVDETSSSVYCQNAASVCIAIVSHMSWTFLSSHFLPSGWPRTNSLAAIAPSTSKRGSWVMKGESFRLSHPKSWRSLSWNISFNWCISTSGKQHTLLLHGLPSRQIGCEWDRQLWVRSQITTILLHGWRLMGHYLLWQTREHLWQWEAKWPTRQQYLFVPSPFFCNRLIRLLMSSQVDSQVVRRGILCAVDVK